MCVCVIFFWKHNFYFTRCLLALLYNFSCFYNRHLQFTFLRHFHYVFTFVFAYRTVALSASVEHGHHASCAYSALILESVLSFSGLFPRNITQFFLFQYRWLFISRILSYRLDRIFGTWIIESAKKYTLISFLFRWYQYSISMHHYRKI